MKYNYISYIIYFYSINKSKYFFKISFFFPHNAKKIIFVMLKTSYFLNFRLIKHFKHFIKIKSVKNIKGCELNISKRQNKNKIQYKQISSLKSYI